MAFIFYALLFPAFYLYHAYQSLFGQWRGELRYYAPTRKQRHVPYWYREKTHRGEIEDLKIGVDCPCGYAFELRREDKRSRFAKWLGLSRERQINVPQFDGTIYLASEHDDLAAALETNSELRSRILGLFERYARQKGIEVHALCLHRGKLWLSFRGSEKAIPYNLANAVVPELLSIAGALPAQVAGRDVFHSLKLAILALNGAFLGYGLLRLVVHLLGRDYLVDPLPFLAFGLFIGLLSILVMVALVVAVMRRTSRTHLVLVDFSTAGVAGILLTTYFLAHDLNVRFDDTPTEYRSVEVVDAYITHGRRGGTYYHLKIRHRAGEANEPVKYEVDGSTYRRLKGARWAVMQVGAGYLGYEWIRAFQVAGARVKRRAEVGKTRHPRSA
jgi:hypothetical protein